MLTNITAKSGGTRDTNLTLTPLTESTTTSVWTIQQ